MNKRFKLQNLFTEQKCFTGQALIITHNGASGVYAGSTDLAYEQSLTDGADIIDCSVQMSKDGIAFCMDSIDVTGDTTATATFMDRSATIPELQQPAGIFSFALSWSEIQTLKRKHLTHFQIHPHPGTFKKFCCRPSDHKITGFSSIDKPFCNQCWIPEKPCKQEYG